MDFGPQSAVLPSSFVHTPSVAGNVKAQNRQQFFNPVTPDISPPRPIQKVMDSVRSNKRDEVFQHSQVKSRVVCSIFTLHNVHNSMFKLFALYDK